MKKVTFAASCLGSGLPALIRNSLCENLGWCSEAGWGDRRKGKFSGAAESPGIWNSAPGRMQKPRNSVKKKRIAHFPTLSAPEILQFVF